jgi:hypothetical protein
MASSVLGFCVGRNANNVDVGRRRSANHAGHAAYRVATHSGRGRVHVVLVSQDFAKRSSRLNDAQIFLCTSRPYPVCL